MKIFTFNNLILFTLVFCHGESKDLHPCIRNCEKDRPMTCKYNFTLEYYVTMGNACSHCQPNGSKQSIEIEPSCQCVFGDGYEKGVLTINRMIPGPSIQVCYNDTIIVDVNNLMEGLDTAIHWHGIHQRETPYFDGVPFVTQCPILGGTSFRYKFKADKPGTHFYHSHSSVQKLDGLYGSLIVRVPINEDPHRNLYDVDLPIHNIILSDYLHVIASEKVPGHIHSNTGQYPDSILVNGFGKFSDPKTGKESEVPYEVITVTLGVRYRFRIINALGTTCDAQFSIENHTLTLIATDGDNFEPVDVDAFVSYSGERFDIILHAQQKPGTYWIQIYSQECFANKIIQFAILRYEGQGFVPSTKKLSYDSPLENKRIYNGDCDLPSTTICITDLHSVDFVDPEILNPTVKVNAYLPYELLYFDRPDPHVINTYKHFIVPPSSFPITALINGISFRFPSSPPISQWNDTSPFATLCTPGKQMPMTPCPKNDCVCPHTLPVNVNDTIEMILIDYSANRYSILTHPFHLHGHSFHVMALGKLLPEWQISMKTIVPLITSFRRRLRQKKIKKPVSKDTLLIPHNGYAIIRAKLKNPGYWFFHCHFAYHIVIGMNMIIKVGENKDFPPIPENFPRCGDYLPGGKLDFSTLF
ncbi:uncharacterized protein [Prorops nasuta]|uniref:uncharacterized protein n=1 Tax=Prorops nasuta TaxID=863751 RepID=UPI0034CF3393